MKVMGIILLPALLCFNDAFSQINNNTRNFDRGRPPLSNYLNPYTRPDPMVSTGVPGILEWNYEHTFSFKKDSDVFANNRKPSTRRPSSRKPSSPDYYHPFDKMPCLKPEGVYQMPCLKPEGLYHMRIFRPDPYFWGTLLAF